MDWDKERNGWYDSNGYHVDIMHVMGENDQFNAMTPYDKPIAIGMPSLETAIQWIDHYRKTLHSGFGFPWAVGKKPMELYHD